MPAPATSKPAVQRSLLWLVGLLCLAGLIVVEVASPTAQTPGELIIINGDEPQTLDPAIITGQLEGRLALSLFEGLTTRNPQGDIVPGMAESWTLSPDGCVYTFKLRESARWSDGQPLTADDFVRSWERTLNPATASYYAYQLYYLVNGQAYGEGKLKDFSQVGVKAPDPHTLVVTLIHPTAYFLELTSFQTLCPVRLDVINRFGHDWIKPGRMISSGPYVLKEWRLNDHITLEANPYYWGPIGFRRIRVLPTDTPTACINLFYSGKADLILDKSSVPPALLATLQERSYFHRNPFGATSFIRFNVTRPPFNDARVRKALALALDKQDIVTKITRAGEPVADTLVPPGYPGYTSPQGLGYHPDEARRLLAEAGFPGGKGFPAVKLLYPARGVNTQMATEMQALWKRELGINSLQLRGEEWKVYLNTQQQIDYDLCLSAWVGDFADPRTFLDLFVTNGGNNLTGWGNAQYDQLLLGTEQTPDPAKRSQLFHDMEKILVEDEVPIAPIYFYVGTVLYRPEKMTGFVPNVVDDHRWNEFQPPTPGAHTP